MTDAIDLRLGDIRDVTTPSARGLLPGRADTDDPIRVDVRVRSYDESPELAPRIPAARATHGRLPVGTLLDCYL
jgi:hypothetical protein